MFITMPKVKTKKNEIMETLSREKNVDLLLNKIQGDVK